MKKTAIRRSTETPLQAPQSTQAAVFDTASHTQRDAAPYSATEATATRVAFDFQQIPLSDPTAQAASASRAASPLPVQRKRVLGPAHDAYEQEADAVATQVIAQLGQAPSAEQGSAGTQAARQTSTPPVLRKVSSSAALTSNESSPIPDVVEGSIQSSLGSGSHLPGNLQSRMEGAFGADFSNVRIHANSDAHNLNSSLGARAFTVGQDVYFGRGEYQPTSTSGQHLLAHELTHVVQQNGSLQNSPSASTDVGATHTGQVPTGGVVQTARGTGVANALTVAGWTAKQQAFDPGDERKNIDRSTRSVNMDPTSSYVAQDISITAADVGEQDDTFTLRGRKYTPKNANGPGAGKAIILFSGSGGSNENQLEPAANFYCRQGSEVFAVNYRGFGKSANKDSQGQDVDLKIRNISEEGMVKDAGRVFLYVNKSAGYSDGNIILHGFSLGGAITAKLTKRLAEFGKKLGGLVLHSSIETMYEAGKQQVGIPVIGQIMGAGAKLAVGSFDTQQSLEEIAKIDPDLPVHFMSGDFAEDDHLALSNTELDASTPALTNTTAREASGKHLNVEQHLGDDYTQDMLATLLKQGRNRDINNPTAVTAR